MKRTVFWAVVPITMFALLSPAAERSAAYLEPRALPSSMFPVGGGPVLFKQERRAVETNGTVYVTCDYTYPDGRLVAQDRLGYRNGQLLWYEEDQLQLGEMGRAEIRPDPKHPGRNRAYFQYTTGQGPSARTSSDSEALENDTLADDMIGPFIASHWSILQSGSPAKFRLLVLSRKETVGFKLVKESETTRKGVPVVRVRMEPTSIIIARLVDPLYFLVEKSAAHRVLEYTGRVTPMVRNGNKWKEVDAVSVFDWSHEVAQTTPGSEAGETRQEREPIQDFKKRLE